jgi:hypothetical protein
VITCVPGFRTIPGRAETVPAQHLGRGDVRDDQVEWVAGLGIQPVKRGLAAGCGPQRELATRPAERLRRVLAATVQDAGHARDGGMDCQPRAARQLIARSDQGQFGPVAGGR